MAQEIEKKFLLKGDFRPEVYKSTRITQAYICSLPERTVRVRIKDDKGYLTIKGKGNASGAVHFEWEKEIPADEARSLLSIAEPGIIEKTRHLIKNRDGKHIWEVDEFHGDNEGLLLAEIELEDENEPFHIPNWIGEEVTGDPRYYNAMLKKNPYKNWNK